MKITPLDIRRKEFKRSVRGYSDEEVDIFLDEVADEFERLFQANMELEDRAHRLEEQVTGHAQMKEALEKTLISAQLQAEELRTNAHKEGELILRDAELKARGIVNDSYVETQRLQQALVQLKLLEEDFRLKFRSLLEGYLKLLNQAPIAEAPLTPAGTVAPSVGGPAGATEGAVPVEPETPAARVEPPAARVEPPAAHVGTPPVTVGQPSQAAPVGQPQAASSPDDAPTEEDGLSLGDVEAAVDAFAASDAGRPATADADTGEVTAETEQLLEPEDRPPQEGQSGQGFFFGRQMDDVDDTFPGEGEAPKNKTRDFEW